MQSCGDNRRYWLSIPLICLISLIIGATIALIAQPIVQELQSSHLGDIHYNCPNQNIPAYLLTWKPYVSRSKGIRVYYPPGYEVTETQTLIQITDVRKYYNQLVKSDLLTNPGDISNTTGTVTISTESMTVEDACNEFNVQAFPAPLSHSYCYWTLDQYASPKGESHARKVLEATRRLDTPSSIDKNNSTIILDLHAYNVSFTNSLFGSSQEVDAWIARNKHTKFQFIRTDASGIANSDSPDWSEHCEMRALTPDIISRTVELLPTSARQ